MDVDCDGDQSDVGDGRCRNDPSNLGQTAFKDLLPSYGTKSKDLNPNFIPYVVLGNDIHGSKRFSPEDFGIKPLSVVAVVCNHKLLYGVWGDTCGLHQPMVGEASLSLATACFGDSMDGNNGHEKEDVLFMAFPGDDAVPGAKAKWDAKSFQEFEDSISDIGDRLVQRLAI